MTESNTDEIQTKRRHKLKWFQTKASWSQTGITSCRALLLSHQTTRTKTRPPPSFMSGSSHTSTATSPLVLDGQSCSSCRDVYTTQTHQQQVLRSFLYNFINRETDGDSSRWMKETSHWFSDHMTLLWSLSPSVWTDWSRLCSIFSLCLNTTRA